MRHRCGEGYANRNSRDYLTFIAVKAALGSIFDDHVLRRLLWLAVAVTIWSGLIYVVRATRLLNS